MLGGSDVERCGNKCAMTRKKILIIGGAGYLGSVLTRHLLDEGYTVRILDAFLFGRKSLDDIHSHPRLEIAEGDIRYLPDVTKSLAAVEGVVLLASLVGEPACDVDPNAAVEVNLLATVALAEACKYYGVERFVFASTDSVYGIQDGIMREDSEKNPISLYARLKLQAEHEILALQAGSFRPIILRMSTLYGYSPRMRFDLVVNTLAMHAVVHRRVRIFGGKQWRPFVHVVDAAHAYQIVLEAPLEVVGGQLFNVGSNDQNYRIEELGNKVLRVFPDVEIETIPQTPDLRDYYVNCDKISRAVGFRPQRSILDGIREIKEAIEGGVIVNPMEGRFYNIHRG